VLLLLGDECAQEVIINKSLRLRDDEVIFDGQFFLLMEIYRVHLS